MKSLTTRRAALALLPLLMLGCAGLRTITSDVASFGEWPAERKPSTYAFDRLPSQAAQAEASDALEATARPALAKAGFQPVAAGQQPDVLVQVGTRLSRSAPGLWSDPLWWRGGHSHWRASPWVGPGWALHPRWESQRYEREVAILLRDRSSGKPLFEARASSDTSGLANAAVMAAMFQAALMDFPKLGINPRRVSVTLAE